jgi:hypothetical protein
MEDKLSTIGQIATLGLLVFGMFKGYFSDNKKQDGRIATIETSCGLKHKAIDDNFKNIDNSLSLIKENHLRHIEERVGAIENKQTEIITILNERLPKK